MGVHGLLTYLKRHPRTRERRLYLRDIAQAKKLNGARTPKLLCDFFNILYWLLGEFHEAMVKCGRYTQFSYLYGGDIVDYEERFLAFVRAIRHLGIEPIFYVDGAKGSHLTGFKAKLRTHRSRHLGTLGRILHCNRVAKYDPREEVESYSVWFPHPLVLLQVMMALKSEGVVLEHCIGEADFYLAEKSQSGEADICGVLTNDTDMVLMRNCEVFPCQFFDFEQELGIRSIKFNSKPSEVVCEKVTPQRLAQVLQIPETDLKKLSVICGNDYTKGLNNLCELHEKMKLSFPIVESAAQWLKDTPYSELEDIPLIEEINDKVGGKYNRAIQYTYKAYDGTFATDASGGAHERSPLYELVLRGVREGKMTRELLSIAANSIHWRTGVMEILDVGQDGRIPVDAPPCIDDLLLPIRLIIYKLLGLMKVTEYGRIQANPYDAITVALKNSSKDLLHHLIRRTELERVCLLTTFLTKAYCLKREKLEEMFATPMRGDQAACPLIATIFRPVLVCASLLFSYDLREKSSSFGLDNITDIFFVTCFMCFLGKAPRKMPARPSPQSTDAATGFSCIIEHSYHLASLLGLFEMMPRPAQMYQSATFVVFYHTATCRSSAFKHQRRMDKEVAETYNAFDFIKKLYSFRKLKRVIEEIYCTSKTNLESTSPHTIFSLAVAFLEVMADVDEADRRSELFFAEDELARSQQRKRPKGKSML